MSDGRALRRSDKGHAHISSNWKIFTSRLLFKSGIIVHFCSICKAPTFSIALLSWDHRSENVRNYPTFVIMLFNYIFLWRNADCGWSILGTQPIYGANAWANVWSQICCSFGEKLSVCSFTSTICVTLFTPETLKIDAFESKYVIILMSWWSLGMIFTS
jgi:hypothetical protein